MSVELHRCRAKSCRHRGPLPHQVEHGETLEYFWLTRRCNYCSRFTRAVWDKGETVAAPDDTGLCPDCCRPWDDCRCEADPELTEVRDDEGHGWLPAWPYDEDEDDDEEEWRHAEYRPAAFVEHATDADETLPF